MKPRHFDCDVAVVGGGPAGSTAATLLARGGHRVVVLERERFPRYHVGESLLSATLPILAHLGVLPEVERRGFVKKPGGTFLWGSNGSPWSFWFREDPGGVAHAYHVLRGEFDEILLRHASREGAEVLEETTVESIAGKGPFRIAARTVDDAPARVDARFVVDASGQQALLGRREGLREYNPFFRNLAVWGYFADAARLEGDQRDNILSAVHSEGWCWYIPLHDGTVSVGAVVDASRWKARTGPETLQATYRSLLERCRPVTELLQGARQVAPVRVIRDYSYSSSRFHHGRALLAGDAACFIDPVFSTGVHLAVLAGLLAADALEDVLKGRRSDSTAFSDYDAAYRRIFERYRRFVTFFYNHHADPESYFWQARKLIESPDAFGLREAFVRLISGTDDLPDDATSVRQIDERWSKSLASGLARTAPGMHLLRAAATLGQMRRSK